MGSFLVYAGDPQRVVGRVSRGAYGTGYVRVSAIVPDPWGSSPGARMSYDDDGPVVFRSGYAESVDDGVRVVCRAAVGVTDAAANVRVVREDVAP